MLLEIFEHAVFRNASVVGKTNLRSFPLDEILAELLIDRLRLLQRADLFASGVDVEILLQCASLW